jgi:hypothetical protein
MHTAETNRGPARRRRRLERILWDGEKVVGVDEQW